VSSSHQPARFAEFKRRYEAELTEPERAEALRHLREQARSGPVTLLTATKDLKHNPGAAGPNGRGACPQLCATPSWRHQTRASAQSGIVVLDARVSYAG